MSSLMPRPGSSLPDLLQWFGSEWPFEGTHPARIESYVDKGEFVVRSELPGLNPEKDIHITVEGNQLKISAERTREERTERHSEFHYGSFSRTLTLPTNCNTDEVKASYDAGILTIRMPVRQAEKSKEIPVGRSGKK